MSWASAVYFSILTICTTLITIAAIVARSNKDD